MKNNKIHIHVINTKGFQERKDFSENLLRSMDVEFTIHEFEKSEIPVKGCTSSHVNMARYAIDNNLDYLLVMEDNAILSPRFYKDGKPDTQKIKNHLNQMINFVVDHGIEFINSGGFLFPGAKLEKTELHKNLFKTHTVLGLSFYITSKNMCKTLIDDYDKGLIKIPVDDHIATYNQYIYFPYLFHHRKVSSIVNKPLEFLRNFIFSNEYYRLVENTVMTSDISFLWSLGILLIILIILFLIFVILFIVNSILQDKESKMIKNN